MASPAAPRRVASAQHLRSPPPHLASPSSGLAFAHLSADDGTTSPGLFRVSPLAPVLQSMLRSPLLSPARPRPVPTVIRVAHSASTSPLPKPAPAHVKPSNHNHNNSNANINNINASTSTPASRSRLVPPSPVLSVMDQEETPAAIAGTPQPPLLPTRTSLSSNETTRGSPASPAAPGRPTLARSASAPTRSPAAPGAALAASPVRLEQSLLSSTSPKRSSPPPPPPPPPRTALVASIAEGDELEPVRNTGAAPSDTSPVRAVSASFRFPERAPPLRC